jgi:putative peptidoglycan lipid II flippase
MTAPTPTLLRSSGAMSALTAVSRLTGFLRIVVVAAVLGPTFLGNTYQSANTVPNLVFELFVAGMLQAVLVPTLVELLDAGDKDEAEHVAGSVLGLAGATMAGLAVVGMLAAPLLMRVLVSGVDDPAVREAEVRLGTFFLWFFLPQVVWYVAGLVATSVLNAQHRFAVAAGAPIVNNVVVIASYVAFWLLRDGKEPSLDLSLAEKLVLAGGTTLGVIAFCSVPVIAVVRSGFRLRPRFDRHHPRVRALVRLGAWAGLTLAMTQGLLGVVLVLANQVEGGVVAYQVGFTFFLLPHALVAIPVATASFPTMARAVQADDEAGFVDTVVDGVRLVSLVLLPAAVGLLVLSLPVARATLFGEGSGAGAALIADTIAAFAPGLLGYGLVYLLARAFYALGDTRTPALVTVGLAVGGAVAMVVAFSAASGRARVPAVAGAHSAAYVAAAAVLLVLLARRLETPVLGRVLVPVGRCLGGAVVAGVVMAGIVRLVDGGGRTQSILQLLAAGGAGLAVYAALQAPMLRQVATRG